MPHAYKIPQQSEDGYELCISEGAKSFWEHSLVAPETTIISWE